MIFLKQHILYQEMSISYCRCQAKKADDFRKLTKPIISVNVVMITPPAIAGSQQTSKMIGKSPNSAAID